MNYTTSPTQEFPTMENLWLSSLKISNFRSCKQTEIHFHPSLTLLVGENNAGKSNIIEALRLATEPLSGQRTRYFNADDMTRGEEGEIALSVKLQDPSIFQQALLISALDAASSTIHYQTIHVPPSQKVPRGKTLRTSGPLQTPESDPENRSRINHVYLAPLRDAKRQLDSGSGRRLGTILRYLLNETEQKQFLNKAVSGLSSLSEDASIKGVEQKIQQHLDSLTASIRKQTAKLGFQEPTIDSLARGLRLKMSENDIDPVDLASSGLGYANLLFISTILIELSLIEDSVLTLLLLEEPEAHLHPQLQKALLDFLTNFDKFNNGEAANSETNDLTRSRFGRYIQVIATTHSPNITSAVEIDHVVSVKSDHEGDTKALALREVNLEEGKNKQHNRRKINQYLDATRSELLFAQKVLLVEGISEAILLPALARHHYGNNIEKYAKFRAVSIINVGSVDFEPYIRLLAHPFDENLYLVDSLYVLTDQDPSCNSNTSTPTNRADIFRKIPPFNVHNNKFKVIESPYTLEVSLLGTNCSNAGLLEAAYLLQHPKSKNKWDEIINSHDPQQTMYAMMSKSASDAKNLNLRKGEFAHDLSILLDSDSQDTFIVPTHLQELFDAIAED